MKIMYFSAVKSRKARAAWLIFLFLGDELVRAERIMGETQQLKAAFDNVEANESEKQFASGCPATHSGCALASMLGYTCEPAACCWYRSGISNLGNHCYLDWPYMQDSELLTEWAKRTKHLIRVLDTFRYDGSAFVFWEADGMKALTRVMQLIEASESTENGEKTWLKKVVHSYMTQNVEEFKFDMDEVKGHTRVEMDTYTLGAAEIPYEFGGAEDGTHYKKVTTAEWVSRSLKIGTQKAIDGISSSSIKAKVQAMFNQAEAATSPADMLKAMQMVRPGATANDFARELEAGSYIGKDQIKSFVESSLPEVTSMLQLGSLLELHADREPVTAILAIVVVLVLGYMFHMMFKELVKATTMNVHISGNTRTGRGRAVMTNGWGETVATRRYKGHKWH